MCGEAFTPPVRRCDGHVAVVDLDLLYRSLGAELSDAAKVFGYVNKYAVVARLTREGLPHVPRGTAQFHCRLVGRTECPGHVAQRGGEAGREHRNHQAGRGLRTVSEVTTC